MSHEEDRCFQCQESGHIVHHCPNVCCFECDEYGHIVVVCVHMEYHPQVHLHIIIDHNPSVDITTAQPHATVLQIGTEAADLRSQSHHWRYCNQWSQPWILQSTFLGHTTEATGDIAGVVHTANSIQTLIHTALAPQHPALKDPPNIEAHQPIHKITADHALIQPIGQLRKPPIKIHPIPDDSYRNSAQ